MLHQTILSTSITEISRVLKSDGTFLGMSELAIPPGLGFIWNSRLGVQGKVARQTGVTYGTYSLNDWQRFFSKAGFKNTTFIVDKNPNYKRSHWFNNLYYGFISHLPDSVIKKIFAFSLDIQAKKQ